MKEKPKAQMKHLMHSLEDNKKTHIKIHESLREHGSETVGISAPNRRWKQDEHKQTIP